MRQQRRGEGGRHGSRGKSDVGSRAAVPADGAPPLRVRGAGGAVRAVRVQAAARLRGLGAGAVGRVGHRVGGRRSHARLA